ncbi:flagellar basal body FlgE domain-containing protein [Planctobacterium marinum]|uniref:BIG2 domain-containing protein n=1 Tax=Planctobacterium marinum TaxID=1631968 RepID=A0AA48HLB2_9ALTE|nr:hypothetical protein MACH26_28500 [Planctobacterium marinum]
MDKGRLIGCLAPLILINGCGSDNVTNITIIEAQKSPQAPLVFSVESLSYYIDETPETNIVSGGSGAGNIVYTSSDSSIAAVDAETGALNLLDDGTVTITATKAGDDIYSAISASYSLSIDKYNRWYTTEGLFSEDVYTVPLDEGEVQGNYFKPTNPFPLATSEVEIEANLPADNTALDPDDFNPDNTNTFNASTSLTIFDSTGESHVQSMYFIKDAGVAANEWLMVTAIDGEFYDFTNSNGTDPADATFANNGRFNHVGFGQTIPGPGGTSIKNGVWGIRLVFDSSGDYVEVQAADGTSLPTGIAGDVLLPTTTPLTGLTTGADATQTIALKILPNENGHEYDAFSQFASPFQITWLAQNGFALGNVDYSQVSYQSADPDIALVDANTGWLTLVSAGETTITATIAEDEYYAETHVSYRLVVQ